MKYAAVVTIDVGHSNAKLTVTTADSLIQEQAIVSNCWRCPPPYLHADVDGIWSWILFTLKSFSSRYFIESIVVSAHGAAAALIADNGLALPILDYEHDEYCEINDEYESLARNFKLTFSPQLPRGLNLGRQLFWLQRKYHAEFSKSTLLLPYPQYWTWKLSGVPTTEITSLGCHTDLWNPIERTFSNFAFEMGWNVLFPPIKPAWHSLGFLKKEIAKTTSLPNTCRVVSGVHDSNAAYLFRKLTNNEVFTVVSTGTWFICMSSNGLLTDLDEQKDMLANVDAQGQLVPTIRFMGGKEYSSISRNVDVETSYADIKYIIDNHIFALPSFADEGGPFRLKRGYVVGPYEYTPGLSIALATMYCALVTDHCLSLLNSNGPIFVEGRFASSSLFCRLLATYRRSQTVLRSLDRTGSLIGAIALAKWPSVPKYLTQDEKVDVINDLDQLDQYRNFWRRRLEDL